jgi:hypothetical protein
LKRRGASEMMLQLRARRRSCWAISAAARSACPPQCSRRGPGAGATWAPSWGRASYQIKRVLWFRPYFISDWRLGAGCRYRLPKN